MLDEIEKSLLILIKSIRAETEYSASLSLVKDLNLDSLDVIGFLFEVEKEFDIKISDEDIDTYELLIIGNLYNYIKNL
jgi:acyl carrier protein